ncbi:MAG: PD-(D/E)XK nuclease family protein [Chloroflexota bacterium]
MAFGGLSLLFVFLMLVLAIYLWRSADELNQESGLPDGNIIYTDTTTWFPNDNLLYAQDVKLVGKPDYLVEEADGQIVPVEIKSSRAPKEPWPSHVLQLAAYCYLVEANYDLRPEYGILQYSDRAFAIDYTADLEEDLLDLLAAMRGDLFAPDVNRDHEDWHKCAKCSVRRHCYERLG